MSSRCRFPAIAAVLILVAAGAQALTIPLPDLVGGYEYHPTVPPNPGDPMVRTMDLVIPAEVAAIDELRLVISGAWTMGEVTCSGVVGPETSPFMPPLSLSLTSDAFPGDFFWATVVVPDGPFTDLTAEFSSCCPQGTLSLDQLLGADLHAEMFMDAMLIGICWVTVDVVGTLTDVRLELTGAVPAEPSSWSSVKSLYR